MNMEMLFTMSCDVAVDLVAAGWSIINFNYREFQCSTMSEEPAQLLKT
jgi:hypothetical protein